MLWLLFSLIGSSKRFRVTLVSIIHCIYHIDWDTLFNKKPLKTLQFARLNNKQNAFSRLYSMFAKPCVETLWLPIFMVKQYLMLRVFVFIHLLSFNTKIVFFIAVACDFIALAA